jgi:hypothetical protein
MVLIGKILLVGGIATFALWGAIPAGLALGLDALWIILAVAAGTSIGVIFAALLSSKARSWVNQRYPARLTAAGTKRLRYIWIRYGVPGLGLLAPLVTGAPVAAFFGAALGAPLLRLISWMCIGAFIWSIILTLVFTGSLAGLRLLLG